MGSGEAVDTIYIEELAVDAVIGVYAWEREVRQTLYLSLTMAADVAAAARGDDIARALDYSAVAARVTDFVSGSQFQLIETLAEQVAGLLREEFSVSWLRLRVSKPGAVINARDVGVVIERGTKP